MSTQPTNVTIGNFAFVCVPLSIANFLDVAAVYVILCVGATGKWNILDVGQTGGLGDRIDSHERRSCWERHCRGKNIWVGVYKMPSDKNSESDRLNVEAWIRTTYGPLPCGTR